MAKQAKKTLTVKISPELIQEFKITCIQYGISVQQGASNALVTWLAMSSKDNLKPTEE